MEQAVEREFRKLTKDDAVLDARFIAWRNEQRPEAQAERRDLFHARMDELRRKAMDRVEELLG